MKYIFGSKNGYTLPPGIYENSDINLMLKFLLPNELKVKSTIDDIRLKTILTTNKTMRFTEKLFFYTILGSNQFHSGPLGDIEESIQKTAGPYKRDKPINITGIDKFHLK